ncbi:hypothetical protein F5X96DRAFT_631488 [Biscogniauxia mediterranea]|nr:hypothetical protein F5X96DRAFT_631488 [Biscogniauxia mediterranea]
MGLASIHPPSSIPPPPPPPPQLPALEAVDLPTTMSLPRHPRALLSLLPRRPTTTTITTTTTTAAATTPPAPSSRAPFSTSPRLGADIIRRPRRPYTFTQLVQLSDGSTYTARTTSPHAVYKSTKDTRNHVLWQPRERSLRNVEVDEAGKLAAFRGRFGTMWDAADANADGSSGSSASGSSAAEDQELKELMEAQGVTAARKLRKQMEKMQRNAEWEKRQMEKRQAGAGAGADAGANAAAPDESSAGASGGGGGEGLSDLIAKYSTPQSQVPNDRTPVVRKKK